MEIFAHANDDCVISHLLWDDGNTCAALISLDDYVDISVIYIIFSTVFSSDLFICFATKI